jgi:hypothetical protein
MRATPVLTRRSEEDVDPLGAQSAGGREAGVEVLEIAQARQRDRLVDDRIEPRRRNGLADRPGIQGIQHKWLGAQLAQPPGLVRRTGRAGHLVPALAKLRNQAGADHPTGSYHQDSHDLLLSRAFERLCRG